MRSVLAAAFLSIGMVALAVACLDQDEACAQEGGIVSAIPWADDETADYVWLDDKTAEVCGEGTLSVARDGGQFTLSLAFTAGDDSDVSTIVVDAQTLQPESVRRERLIDGESEIVEAEYDDAEKVIRVVEIINDKRREVPRRLDDDVYFDNEMSLFLWRTLRFEAGYETEYNTVLANQGGAQREVRLRVDSIETITVPAGTFDAWRVEIVAGDVNQLAWFTDTPEHYLLQYHNSVQIFQLNSPIP